MDACDSVGVTALPLDRLFEHPPPEQAVILARGPSLGFYDPARHPAAAIFGVNDLGVHRDGQTHQDRRVDFSVYIDGHLLGGCDVLGTPIRPVDWAKQFCGVGYFWSFGRDQPDLRTMFARTGSAAMMIPWLWGCRDIWIYGMDAYPNCDNTGSAIGEGIKHNPSRGYLSTVNRQKMAVEELGVNCVTWAHLEATC
jgi:hypothetical protein